MFAKPSNKFQSVIKWCSMCCLCVSRSTFRILKRKFWHQHSVPTCKEPTKEEAEITEQVPRATTDHQIQDYLPERDKYRILCPHLSQSLNKLSSPGPKPLVPNTPMPNPNQVTISSKTQLVPRGLGLTLNSCGPALHCSLGNLLGVLNHPLGLTLSTPCIKYVHSHSRKHYSDQPLPLCNLWSMNDNQKETDPTRHTRIKHKKC